jgi:hypothetical protein
MPCMFTSRLKNFDVKVEILEGKNILYQQPVLSRIWGSHGGEYEVEIK